MDAELIHDSYGKSAIRLTRVLRGDDRHQIREWTVSIRLEGQFAASYLEGDNRSIIATDTIKNLVYALAQGRPVEPMEVFGAALATHLLEHYAQIQSVVVHLIETAWQRIRVEGRDHPHAFVRGLGTDGQGAPERVAEIYQGRGKDPESISGIIGLHVLKTTGSGFVGFVRDRYTTLPETTDRIFATEVEARWQCDGSSLAIDHDQIQTRVVSTLLATFADHPSLSVQQTLHAMGTAALGACPELSEITLRMPNKHRILADLGRFGLANPNEVFIATEEPYGLISGTLRRPDLRQP